MDPYAKEELLACCIARLIGDAGHVAVGAASPIPATGAFFSRAFHNKKLRISLLHKRAGNPFTEGSRELFDLAGQGRIDVFFLGGAQIDGEANVNLVQAGGHRFPGSFGSAFMYFAAGRTILFREEHSKRVLVPKVDFISAPGWSPPEVRRRGGPQALLTGKALFVWQPAKRRFFLASAHPGHTVDEIRENTGFEFDFSSKTPVTPVPAAEDLRPLRNNIARQVAANYPEFARRVWNVSAAA
jgi:glutaconate CoA-transferase subunit B